VDRRKASRVKRSLVILAVCAVAVLAGCKDPNAPGSSGGTASSLVHPAPDIVVKDVRTFAPGDQVQGSNDEYYVITFTFTNDQGQSLAPRINHFILQDDQNRRFYGVDQGNINLIGISNYSGVLKQGDSHDYTVGFRVPVATVGTLFYDSSF
jgi:hypothetical protein